MGIVRMCLQDSCHLVIFLRKQEDLLCALWSVFSALQCFCVLCLGLMLLLIYFFWFPPWVSMISDICLLSVASSNYTCLLHTREGIFQVWFLAWLYIFVTQIPPILSVEALLFPVLVLAVPTCLTKLHFPLTPWACFHILFSLLGLGPNPRNLVFCLLFQITTFFFSTSGLYIQWLALSLSFSITLYCGISELLLFSFSFYLLAQEWGESWRIFQEGPVCSVASALLLGYGGVG